MPQADQDLVDKLQAIVQANFSGGPEPWNTVTAGHGEIREYCEALLENDGFKIDGGWMTEPDKYANTTLPEEIADAAQYLIDEWDFALGEKPEGVVQIRVYPLFDNEDD